MIHITKKSKRNFNGSFNWSEEELRRLQELYHENYTDAEIAEKIGRTHKAVQSRRCAMMLPKKRLGEKMEIADAMEDYYPRWYRQKLEKEWIEKQRQRMSTKS